MKNWFNVIVFCVLSVLFVVSCKTDKTTNDKINYSELDLQEKPNILWLVTEDIGPYLQAFGDSTVKTPNLSRLAEEGVIYPNLYSVSGVCAPSRSAIATGMYPTGIGTNHMRTGSNTKETGLPKYEGVPAPEVKMVSELLRSKGYYCTNNYKTDYQFKAPVTAWDESSPYAHWRNRKQDQPFFSIFNFTETHESGLFDPYGFRHIETRHYHEGDRKYKWKQGRMTEEETPVHLSKNTKFTIPPYLPDNEITRRDMWKLYNNIAEMDKQVGAVLQQLENDGLLDNTIVFFYSDHGGPLPRQKRLIYDSGLNSPMIIRFPKKQLAGSKDAQLISFVDFAPTLLSLIGVEPPEYINGKAFLGQYKAKTERKYIHAAADRFDEVTDCLRAVRDKRYKYIRNYRPNQGYYLPLAYRERIPTMKELLRLRDNNELNEIQLQWFRKTKPNEELFDCIEDPNELNNIANNPKYKEKLNELRSEMDRWIKATGDIPNLPEKILIERLWNGAEKQPITTKPEINVENGLASISCDTKGASIGYKIVYKNEDEPRSWNVYNKPFRIKKECVVLVKAHRIGYKPSQTCKLEF